MGLLQSAQQVRRPGEQLQKNIIIFTQHGGQHEEETCKSALSGSNGGIRNFRMRKQRE
jgi:hypothetical protein